MENAQSLHGAVNDLQDGLSDLQEQLQKILVVVQGEQERAAAIEKSAASDHAFILELDQRVASAKSFREKDLLSTNMHHKDINALQVAFAEACRRIDAHDAELDIARSRLSVLELSSQTGVQKTAGLAVDLQDLRHAVEVNARESCESSIQLSTNTNHIERLGALLEEMSANLKELRANHEQTTSSHNVVARSLEDVIVKANGENSRLSTALCQLQALEQQGASTIESTTHLHAMKDHTLSQIRDLEERLLASNAAINGLQIDSQQRITVERAHSQQLDDAERHIQSLNETGCGMTKHLKQLQLEVDEVQVTLRKREEHSVGVINTLTTLQHNLKAVDAQVLDVQATLRASDAVALSH